MLSAPGGTLRDAKAFSDTKRPARHWDYRSPDGHGTMPTMRMPWSKSGNLQLDLLDAPSAADTQPQPPAPLTTAVSPPSMVTTACLCEDADNPRTEIPDAELDELADDIRQHGILQPIVVHPADAEGRHCIHFGAKRWRAAQRIGLLQVPVVVREGPTDPYAQVAENQKRHGLTPLDLARFIRARIDAGESNTVVARKLGVDLTTVAHHLALLDLPPVLDAALKTGRCSSPRTLYELGKLHAEQAGLVEALLASDEPLTRTAVAALRASAPSAPSAAGKQADGCTAAPDPVTTLIGRSHALCDRLDRLLIRLADAGPDRLPAEQLVPLRQRLATLAQRLAG
jgi:ParB family transcriptional regulator, chromosome partitioning protein